MPRNEFQWRGNAKQMAKWDVAGSVILATVIIILAILQTMFLIWRNDKSNLRQYQAIQNSVKNISKVLNTSPSSLPGYISITIMLMMISLFFYARATRLLLNGTDLPTNSEGIQKALDDCKSWQIINTCVLFIGLLISAFLIWRLLRDGAFEKAYARLGEHRKISLGLFNCLVCVMIRYRGHREVGNYTNELRQELRKRE